MNQSGRKEEANSEKNGKSPEEEAKQEREENVWSSEREEGSSRNHSAKQGKQKFRQRTEKDESHNAFLSCLPLRTAAERSPRILERA